MKYVFVALESKSSAWKKGDRIVVLIDEDNCFLGTITSIRQNKIHMLCDDRDTHVVSINSKRILGKGINRKVKKSLLKGRLLKVCRKTESRKCSSKYINQRYL